MIRFVGPRKRICIQYAGEWFLPVVASWPRLLLASLALAVFAIAQPGVAVGQGIGPAISDFDDGNRRYEMGDFQGAVESYHRALERGYASEALYFNLGNAYFRLDQVGRAIQYYEKARRLAPARAALRHNLSIAREHTQDRFSQLPEPFWMPFWKNTINAVGASGLFAIGFFFYLLGCAALFLRIRSGQTPWRRRAATIGLSLAVIVLTAGFLASADELRTSDAVVLVDEAALLDDPAGASSDLTVHEGLVVGIVGTSGQWTEIQLPNGSRGWVRSEDLGKI